MSLDTFLANMAVLHTTRSNVQVTPESCMESPTIQAIVQAVSRRIAVSPLEVVQLGESNGLLTREKRPQHPANRLLRRPNDFQNRHDYWLDAVSCLLRWGRYHALKLRGTENGTVRALQPLVPANIEPEDGALRRFELAWRITLPDGGQRVEPAENVHSVRLGSRNFVMGASPIADIAESIALEIAAERFGAEFFGNGAMPFIMFEYMEGYKELQTDEEKKKFLSGFKEAYGDRHRHEGMLLPKGIKMRDPIDIDNDKGQFLQTREYQRTVIAGAYNVPPHMVGDLSKGTFNNVEQQDRNFVLNVVLPIAEDFEAAMDKDLLTDDEISDGYRIQFNLDAVIRADFKSRQDGNWRRRQAGVINADEWRAEDGLNPIGGEAGSTFWQPVNMADGETGDVPGGNEAGGDAPLRLVEDDQ